MDGGRLAAWVVGTAPGHHPLAARSAANLKRLVNRLRVDPFVLPDPLLGVEKQSQHTGSRPVEGTGGLNHGAPHLTPYFCKHLAHEDSL